MATAGQRPYPQPVGDWLGLQGNVTYLRHRVMVTRRCQGVEPEGERG